MNLYDPSIGVQFGVDKRDNGLNLMGEMAAIQQTGEVLSGYLFGNLQNSQMLRSTGKCEL